MKESFSTLAPELWRRGWRGLVPLRPFHKAPAIRGWQRFNGGQSQKDLDELCGAPVSQRKGSGIGACAGNGVLFVDLDIEDQKTLIRAVVIAEDLLDMTPLHRIGQPPKRVLMYRSDVPGLRRNPRDLAIELYGGGRPATGQVVLHGMHPKTGGPYEYLHETPFEADLAQLPEVYPEQIDALIDTLAKDPLVQAHGMVKRADLRNMPAGNNLGTGLAEAAKHRDGNGGLASWVANTAPGGRHAAATAAVMVITQSGLDPDEETIELEAIEIAFHEAKPDAARGEWRSIMRWARERAPGVTRNEAKRRLGIGGAHGRA
jgi:hypothetical protein